MTRRGLRPVSPTIDAPSPRGHQDRLHNSGWGRPPEQYRTPALGLGALLELPLILGSWPELEEAPRARVQEALRKAHRPRRAPQGASAMVTPSPSLPSTRHPLPVELVGDMARWAREGVEARWDTRGLGLPHRGVGASTPLVELAWLRDLVVALQWTSGVVLTGTQLGAHEEPELPAFHLPTNVEEVALALVTAAMLHGPVVLWGAAPSLEPVRCARRLRLRWVSPSRAHPEARVRWHRLLGTEGGA